MTAELLPYIAPFLRSSGGLSRCVHAATAKRYFAIQQDVYGDHTAFVFWAAVELVVGVCHS
jgi:hypothetical protein